MQNLLENKVAIITGAGRGIGAATAKLFAQAGAALVLVARTEAEIQGVAREIKAAGGTALAIATDVTKVAQVDFMVTMTIRAFHEVHILVNNAGVLLPIGKTWEVNSERWRSLIDINVVGPYLTSRAVLPQILEQGQGRVINISSGAAHRPMAGWSAYCASKAALDQFTRVLALEVDEMAGDNADIVVASLNPGATDTAIQKDIRQTSRTHFPQADMFQSLYEKEQLFQPEEPAQLILWLASKFGAGQNGAILDLADDALREKIAQDLAMPLIPNRRAS